MMIIILFILPVLTNAKISLNITINATDIKIEHYGRDNKIVTNQELHLFNLTTENIVKGIVIEMGKAPNNVYVKDPTTYGNVYEKFNWAPVQRSLKVNKARIINIHKEDMILKTQIHINNATEEMKFKRRLYETVYPTAQSSWFVDGIPSDDIKYDVAFNFSYGIFGYENRWRDVKHHSSRMAIGATKEGFITVKPLQTVLEQLTVTKVLLIMEVEYKAELIGSVVANYAQTYGKYHFWAPSVQSIMKAAKLKNEVLSREQIEVRCFIDPKVDVRDKMTGEILEPAIKRPMVRIFRNKNVNYVLHMKLKKKKQEEKKA